MVFWISFLSGITLDQFSKLLATDLLKSVVNPGIAWGWMSTFPAGILNFFLLLIVIFLGKFWLREWREYQLISGLFWAGVTSNLIDRFLLGGVTDWLVLPFWEVKNNLADIFIFLGVVRIVWRVVLEKFIKQGSQKHVKNTSV